MNRRKSDCLQISRYIAGFVQNRITGFHWHVLDEFADAKFLLPDDFDTNNIPGGIVVDHHETLLRSVRLGADNRSAPEPHVGSSCLGVSFHDRRFGDLNDECLNAFRPSIR